MPTLLIAKFLLLGLLAVGVCFFDIYYRRIPNKLVVVLLLSGFLLNLYLGEPGVWLSCLQGVLLGLGLMLLLHVGGALGAGDVKLFAAIGALLGVQLIWPTFLIVILTGGVLATATAIYSGTARVTAERVLLILGSLINGLGIPRFPVPTDKRQTIPYGVAIMAGSLISLVWHNV